MYRLPYILNQGSLSKEEAFEQIKIVTGACKRWSRHYEQFISHIGISQIASFITVMCTLVFP